MLVDSSLPDAFGERVDWEVNIRLQALASRRERLERELRSVLIAERDLKKGVHLGPSTARR